MSLIAIIIVIIFAGLILGPQYWVRKIMADHDAQRPDFPGTGGELAEHLIEQLELEGVVVESTEMGDHYDPETRRVRLSKKNYESASLTAVAVAAHEVGHALQHANGETGLQFRRKLVSIAEITDKFASLFFLGAPVIAVFARTPASLFVMVGIGVALLGFRIVVHLATLPVEYDASFRKALPILEEGGYLQGDDLLNARHVLKAAALTYVSAALMGLIDLARWIRMIR